MSNSRRERARNEMEERRHERSSQNRGRSHAMEDGLQKIHLGCKMFASFATLIDGLYCNGRNLSRGDVPA